MKKILIAGLGIAGSSLLYLLKQHKETTSHIIVCDVRFSPWSHIVCGELVPEVADLKGKVPDNVYRYLKASHNIIMDNTKILRKFDRMIISIEGFDIGFSFNFYMIDKGLLIRRLIERSEDICELMLGYSAYRYEKVKDRVRVYLRSRDGSRACVDVDKVLACDSFPSVFYTSDIWHRLASTEYRYLTCISCVAEMRDHYAYPYIILSPRICPGGYAWIFPRSSDTANVGLGFLTENIADIKVFLERFLKVFNLKILGKALSKTLPVDGVLLSNSDNILYLGDAGGFVMPTNGAGINPAIASSIIAVESRLDRRIFNKKVLDTFGIYFMKLVSLRKRLDKYLTDPILFEKLRRDIVRNRIFLPFFRRILRDLMLGHVMSMHRIVISCIDSLVASFKFSGMGEV